jgi:hypothetical protein
MSDLQVVENTTPAVTDMFQLEPVAKMQFAGQIANVLKDIIDKQKLFTQIGPNKHVNIEGWSTLGSILGILPKENRVIKIPDNQGGGYEAHVDLIRANDGGVCGGASSICTRAERTWAKRDDYALRSMAITRATGKAYRLAFAWIINLAGYSGTPLEEMPMSMPATPQKVTHKPEGFNSNIDSHKEFIKKQYPEISEWDDVKLEVLYKKIHGKTGDAVGKVITGMRV